MLVSGALSVLLRSKFDLKEVHIYLSIALTLGRGVGCCRIRVCDKSTFPSSSTHFIFRVGAF